MVTPGLAGNDSHIGVVMGCPPRLLYIAERTPSSCREGSSKSSLQHKNANFIIVENKKYMVHSQPLFLQLFLNNSCEKMVSNIVDEIRTVDL